MVLHITQVVVCRTFLRITSANENTAVLCELCADCWQTWPSQRLSASKASFPRRKPTETVTLKLRSIFSCANRLIHWPLFPLWSSVFVLLYIHVHNADESYLTHALKYMYTMGRVLEKVSWIPTNSNWKRILVKTERQGICYLCEELSDAWQWDLAYESWAWIEDESHWNEYDQMDV